MINKIDKNLLCKVKALSDNNYDCILNATDYYETKKILDNQALAYTEYPFINSFFVSTTYNNLINLSENNCITYLSSPTKVSTCVNNAKATMQYQNLVEKNYLGADTTIAFIDTGIYPHLDFIFPKYKIKKFVDLIHNKTVPYDDNGHGSFVAGVCSGFGVVNKQFSGFAPNSDIVMIKALDEKGETDSNKILEAMQYIYENADKLNIRVVCMSFGADNLGENDPLQKGANALWDKGLVVVAAAGNSGPNTSTIKSPGSSEKIITVGGLDSTKYGEYKVAEFSSRGPVRQRFKPDLVAPSVNVTSVSNTSATPYTSMSGTSVATPMIAGVCSILLSKNKHFTPNQIKYYLLNHCTHINFDKNSEGFGYLKF